MNAAERVHEGARRLDMSPESGVSEMEWPAVWRSRLDTEKLNIFSPYNCVLGQIYGSFTAGIDMLFGMQALTDMAMDMRDDDIDAQHGFNVCRAVGRKAIENAWIELLKA